MKIFNYNSKRLYEVFRLKSLCVISMLIFLGSALFAQDRSAEIVNDGWGVPEEPFNCEMNMLYMDILSNNLPEHTKDRSVLIIVARLGKGELARDLSRRRLHNAWQYQIDRRKVPPQKIVLVEGAGAANSFGRLEFYLDGKMTGSLLIPRNRDFCVDCCETRDPNYYPEKARVRGVK